MATAKKLNTTALLLIDIQLGFDDEEYWGPRSNAGFEHNVTSLLAAFRAVLPPTNILHVAHHSTNPKSPLHPSTGQTRHQPYADPLAEEFIFIKDVNSAFIGTELESELRRRGIKRLFICGLTTDQCVSTTVRMANNLHVCRTRNQNGEVEEGEVILVGDATATHPAGGFDAELVQKVHEATLGKEFCTLVTTEEAVAQVERRAKDVE